MTSEHEATARTVVILTDTIIDLEGVIEAQAEQMSDEAVRSRHALVSDLASEAASLANMWRGVLLERQSAALVEAVKSGPVWAGRSQYGTTHLFVESYESPAGPMMRSACGVREGAALLSAEEPNPSYYGRCRSCLGTKTAKGGAG